MNADEQKQQLLKDSVWKYSKGHCIVTKKTKNKQKKPVELDQPICIKVVLTSEWKERNVLCWGRGFIFVSTGEEKLWILSRLIKRSGQGRPPKTLPADKKK